MSDDRVWRWLMSAATSCRQPPAATGREPCRKNRYVDQQIVMSGRAEVADVSSNQLQAAAGNNRQRALHKEQR
jgi:hypothetical protein